MLELSSQTTHQRSREDIGSRCLRSVLDLTPRHSLPGLQSVRDGTSSPTPVVYFTLSLGLICPIFDLLLVSINVVYKEAEFPSSFDDSLQEKVVTVSLLRCPEDL